METLNKLKELLEDIEIDSSKVFAKGTVTRGRSARKKLSEVSKLCKQARQEILDKMNEAKK